MTPLHLRPGGGTRFSVQRRTSVRRCKIQVAVRRTEARRGTLKHAPRLNLPNAKPNCGSRSSP